MGTTASSTDAPQDTAQDTAAPAQVTITDAKPPIPATATQPAEPAVVTVSTPDGFFQHEADSIHNAIVKALAWIEEKGHELAAKL